MNIAKIILLCLYGVSLLLSAYSHGKPKEGTHSFWSSLIGTAIVIGLLWWGGFFE